MKRNFILLGFFLIVFGFYLQRCAPTITPGDSTELAAVGGTLGIGHPPGYPLFAILGRIGVWAFPWGNTAYRMTLQSALWSALAATIVVWTLWQWTASGGAALAAGLLLAGSPLWMDQALITEVFALNSCIAAGILALSLSPPNSVVGNDRIASLVALLFGIGLANQQTLILLAPALVLALWPAVRRDPIRVILGVLFCGIAGLVLYLYLPIRAHRLPLMDWEEPATWERFWKLVTRARFGTFQLAQGQVSPLTAERLLFHLKYSLFLLSYSFGIPALLIIIGIFAGLRKPWRFKMLVCLCAFVVSGPLFFFLANIAPTDHTRAILDRFFFLPLVPAALLLGLGLDAVGRFLILFFSLPHRIAAALLLLLAVGTFIHLKQAWPNERERFFLWDFGQAFLHTTPPQSWLLADRADEAEFSVAYLQRVEGVRPDVHFVDCNAGVSRSIYGPTYYDFWGKPRLIMRTDVERHLVEQVHDPVYYATEDPKMIDIPRVQEGLLYKVPRTAVPRKAVPWDQLLVCRNPWEPPRPGAGWDRREGLYTNYLELLAQDALLSRDYARARQLYAGVFAYEGPSEWRTQMQNYLNHLPR